MSIWSIWIPDLIEQMLSFLAGRVRRLVRTIRLRPRHQPAQFVSPATGSSPGQTRHTGISSFHQCVVLNCCVLCYNMLEVGCSKWKNGLMFRCVEMLICVEMFSVSRCVEMSTSTLPQLPQTEPSTSRTKFIIFQLQLSQKQFSYCEQIPIPVDFLTFSREELLHLSKHSSLKMLKILDVAIF